MYTYQRGTITRTGISSKKTPSYMRNSACRWRIAENAKYFEAILNVLEISQG